MKTKKPITEKNVLAVLPASPADVAWALGHEDAASWNKAAALLDKMRAEDKVWARSRTADDPVYYSNAK